MTEEPEITLRPTSQDLAGGVLYDSALMLACFLPVAALLGWRIVAGTVLVLFILQLIPLIVSLCFHNEYLRLSSRGLKISVMGSVHFSPWSKYREFVPYRRWGRERIRIRYDKAFPPPGMLRRISNKFEGFPGSLRYTYGMKAEDLAAYLNGWVLKYKGG
jgi:hypothetical protein